MGNWFEEHLFNIGFAVVGGLLGIYNWILRSLHRELRHDVDKNVRDIQKVNTGLGNLRIYAEVNHARFDEKLSSANDKLDRIVNWIDSKSDHVV